MPWRRTPQGQMPAGERLRRLGLDGTLMAHVYMPLFFGIVFGWLRVSRTHDWAFVPALTYWILAVQICWLVQGAATWALQRVLEPRKTPLVLLLFCGAIIGTPFINFSMRMLIEIYQTWIVEPAFHKPVAPASISNLVDGHLIGVFIWVMSNLAIVHLLGFARFGFVRPAAAQDGAYPAAYVGPGQNDPAPARHAAPKPPPQFIARLTRPVGRLCMLKAEQHYLRVIGEYGDDLILYRISEAVDELRDYIEGLRVHRSFWVALDAVSHIERGAHGLGLRLRNGDVIPVSRSCRDDVMRAGFAYNYPRISLVRDQGNPDAFEALDSDVRANRIVGQTG